MTDLRLWALIGCLLTMYLVVERVLPKILPKRAYRYRKSYKRAPYLRVVEPAAPNLADPAQQMEAVHKSTFERTRLLNKEEARLLPILEETVRGLKQGHRVMAQTSLGELIRAVEIGSNDTTARNAHASINSKRLDFAIIDRSGFLVCAVEYQGTGHHQGRAFMRDAVKREALRKAGVPMVEADPGITAERLTQRVIEAISSEVARSVRTQTVYTAITETPRKT